MQCNAPHHSSTVVDTSSIIVVIMERNDTTRTPYPTYHPTELTHQGCDGGYTNNAYISFWCTIGAGYATEVDCQKNYGTDCTKGEGWYCDSNADASSTTLDNFHVCKDCDNDIGVTYDKKTKTWYCSNDMP